MPKSLFVAITIILQLLSFADHASAQLLPTNELPKQQMRTQVTLDRDGVPLIRFIFGIEAQTPVSEDFFRRNGCDASWEFAKFLAQISFRADVPQPAHTFHFSKEDQTRIRQAAQHIFLGVRFVRILYGTPDESGRHWEMKWLIGNPSDGTANDPDHNFFFQCTPDEIITREPRDSSVWYVLER